MGLENTYKMEQRPIPQSDVSVVIADDEKELLDRTIRLLKDVLERAHIASPSIHESQDINDLFNSTFKGKDGGPVDMVIIDNNYDRNTKGWTLPAEIIIEQAQYLGVDLSAYKDTIHGAVHMAGMIDTPSGVNLSILLRLMGFEGNIFISSAGLPNPIDFGTQMEEVSRKVPAYTPKSFPVDGVIAKDFETRAFGSQWARELTPDNDWNTKYVSSYTQGLLGLLTYKPVPAK